MKQQEHFLNNLPNKPYCTNDLTYGLKVRPKATAIKTKYIQPNHPDWLTCLVFDLDQNAYNTLEDIQAKPNIAVFNPISPDRGHFIYLLSQPINTGKNGRYKPIKYASAIKSALAHQLKSDPYYTGLITKNPTHSEHLTYSINRHLWDLDHLADYLDLSQKQPQRVISEESRHCTMFDLLRFKAYAIVEQYRQSGAFDLFTRTLTAYAEEKNHFDNLPPLPYSSIKATVKSVSKWTWSNYTGDHKKRGRDKDKTAMLSDLKDRQAYSAIITNKQRVQTTESKIKTAVRRLLAKGEKITVRAVAEQAGLHRNTVSQYKKLLK
jgi:hypothetical protein